MRAFSWSTFFEQQRGGPILERWRTEWKQEFDFILLDSRTGITDAGGVCTILLPDFLVLVFTANEQSFESGKQIALGVQKARRELAVQRPPLTIFPLLGRFDGREEFDEGQRWLNRFATELKPFYDDWLPTRFDTRQVLELTKIPYITKFSFGEPLPVISHGVRDPDGPGFYLDKVAELLVSDFSKVSKILAPNESESLIFPDIWNVPYNRNPNFTGREQLLKNIRASLTSNQRAAMPLVIHGLGGVGKTQLALEYAYRHLQDYDLVWWVRAGDPVVLGADYAALAEPLNLPEKEAPEQEVTVVAVRRRLKQFQKWLLIFDNANDPKDLKDYLPNESGGHVIITSRNMAWRGMAQSLNVKVWNSPESVAFLLKRTGRDGGAGEGEEAAAGQLADELGGLPLALEQAGAYIEECGCSIAQYLELFRSRRQEVLKRGKPSQEYPDTVATTWELSFQKVKAASPAAADLLNLCAFLAPDDIPKGLLVEGAKHLPQSLAAAVRDPVAFNDALAVLRRYSLMEVSGEALAMHRLVQVVVRDRLDEEGKKQWVGAAVEMVNAAFPSDIPTDVETWPWCARLLPHALAASGHAENLWVALADTGKILNQAALYLQIRAEFIAAKKVFERALSIVEVAFGPNSPMVAVVSNNLGAVIQVMGDYERAKSQYARALSIDEVAYGLNHPAVARDLNNLGSVLRAQGNLAGARAHYKRALSIDEESYGSTHPDVASDVNNLGAVLEALGDLDGAMAHYERALAIDKAAYGPDHPQVAIRVNNLGSVLMAQGDLEGAKWHYTRAMSIDEAAYGPNHPKVAKGMNNLGSVLRAQGDLAGAQAYIERALAIWEKAYGSNHPQVATAANNLGLVLKDQGNLEGAKALVERALAIDEAVYGANHLQLALRVNNLGSVLKALGDLAGAKAHYERALAISRQFLGDDHPNTKLVQNNLAALGLPLDE